MQRLFAAGAFFLMLIVSSFPASALAGFLPDSDMGTAQAQDALENCFVLPDPGSRSACILDSSVREKDVTLCDLIEIPGMIHNCIDEVAEVTEIRKYKCKTMNENYKGHCFQRATAD